MSDLAWHDYLSTTGFIVLPLTLLYGFVERRTGGQPGTGYILVLAACLAVRIPDEVIDGRAWWGVVYAGAVGVVLGVLLERRWST
jgi:hypothetical protein